MRDPRRMMCATILALQCIVLGLSTPVLITVEDVDKAAALWIGLGLALAALLLAGLLRFEWAYYAGFVLQAATFALGFVISVMFILGPRLRCPVDDGVPARQEDRGDRAAWGAQPPVGRLTGISPGSLGCAHDSAHARPAQARRRPPRAGRQHRRPLRSQGPEHRRDGAPADHRRGRRRALRRAHRAAVVPAAA